MEEVDQERALAWAQEDNTSRRPRRDTVCYLWHQRLPGAVGQTVSWRGILLGSARVFVILFLSTSIVWRRIGDADHEPSSVDFALVAAMALVMLAGWWIDRALGKKNRRSLTDELEQQISIDMAAALKKMSDFIESFSKENAGEILQDQFHRLLRAMEHKTRTYLQREDRFYFNVSLLVFTGYDGEMLEIRGRSREIRRRVDGLDARQSAAFYVAKAQRAKVIHDFRANAIFPQRGLSEPELPYRSILLLPLDPVTINSAADSRRVCRAVVSIDSQRAYEFWGTAVTNIEVQMRPFLSVLNMMLTEQAEGVPITQ